jgi:hypothetical protein
MATEVLIKYGTQIRFCVTASFSAADPATDHTIGTPTDVALTLSGVVSAAARQSDKANLGATRASRYEVMAAFDFTGETPSATGHVALYWAPSTHATAANGNVAGNSGLDAAAPNGALGSITLAEFLKQCQYIGELPTHDGAVVQNGLVNPAFQPTSRYGQMIVVNNAGDDFEALNTQMAVWMTPIIDEAQN